MNLNIVAESGFQWFLAASFRWLIKRPTGAQTMGADVDFRQQNSNLNKIASKVKGQGQMSAKSNPF